MAERFSDRAVACDGCLKPDSAHIKIASMSIKGKDKERTDWHQVTARCKACRSKFEKRDDFIEWVEPTKK